MPGRCGVLTLTYWPHGVGEALPWPQGEDHEVVAVPGAGDDLRVPPAGLALVLGLPGALEHDVRDRPVRLGPGLLGLAAPGGSGDGRERRDQARPHRRVVVRLGQVLAVVPSEIP